MRDPQQPRRRWPGPALGLLLTALALAGCGRGDGTAERADTTVTADSAQLRLARADSAECEAPPSPPPSLLRPGASWAALEAWLAQNQITFPDTPENIAVDTVPMCLGCTSVGVRLQSTDRTYCLTKQQSAQQRIAGRLTLLDTFPAQNGYQTIPRGAQVYMFSRGTPGMVQPATVVYKYNDAVTHAPPTAWRFYYCDHQLGGTRPGAQWRPEDTTPRPPGDGDNGGGNGGGTYGWMACANGCCQFYTPPPIMTPDPANEHAPDTVPPHGPGGMPPPKWCTGAMNHP